MNDEGKQREVLVEREGKTWRWGQSGYFRKWSGLKQTVNQKAVKAVALPIAFSIGILTFFVSKEKEMAEERGREFGVPIMTNSLPIINAPILTEQFLAQAGGSNRGRVAEARTIHVFNLRSLTDIPVGSEAKAILESGATNGIVKARLVSAISVDGDPILPAGVTLFGRGKSSEERLFVEFEKVIFPGGESYAIRGHAFDATDKILGLKGALVGTKTKKMGMAVGFGLLGGMADGLQGSSGSNIWGGAERKSVRDAALGGASKAALDQSKVYMEEMKTAPTIIEVKKGTEFYLIIDEPKKKESGYGD